MDVGGSIVVCSVELRENKWCKVLARLRPLVWCRIKPQKRNPGFNVLKVRYVATLYCNTLLSLNNLGRTYS